jgi:DNA polymerase III alpha subunit
LRVTENTWEVSQFNQNVVDDQQLQVVGPEPVNLDFGWQLPQPYLGWSAHDLDDYVSAAFEQRARELVDGYSEQQSALAVARICDELGEIHRRGMTEFMKTVIYVLDVFKATGTVWGVGRGSSCASYVLFILGLHSVDCLLYGVPMEEFFHD